jgi:diadenosine tetraphosphate (Ap4A) HIT family hydrolase
VCNSPPHLHAHLLPRFTDDPRPAHPFPLAAQQPDQHIPGARLLAEAAALFSLLL